MVEFIYLVFPRRVTQVFVVVHVCISRADQLPCVSIALGLVLLQNS